jgi:hypothetical protein
MVAALGMAVEKTIKACLEHAAARSRTTGAKTTPAQGVKRERDFFDAPRTTAPHAVDCRSHLFAKP